MAAINDLIQQIDDKNLRDRLQQEVARLNKQKKFGLVFEDHIPECTPLYGVAVRKGSLVAIKGKDIRDVYFVSAISNGTASIINKSSGEKSEHALETLVAVAQFGEPIFPSLIPMDRVFNAPDSSLWHTLIEADNFHALQLLEYLYPKQVDCIYIDPPYNTGARDWKYNNDYVDVTDNYRHSKWLSMMQRRLKIAKRLLNPDTGVLIVTIDEHEVHHLRMLLEEIFSDYYIQMVTAVINPKGVTQGRFSRVEEYVIYCFAPNAFVQDSDDNLLNPPDPKRKPRWKGLLRSGTDSLRADRESMFYPVLIDREKQTVVSAKSYLPLPTLPNIGEKIDGYDVAWPIRKDGSLGRWSVGHETLNTLIKKGYVSCGKFDNSRKTWGISYISQPNQKKIEDGTIRIVGRDPITNVVEIEYVSDDTRVIKTVWHRSYHDAGAYGSDMVTNIIGQSRAFSFPKSLYSTKDALNAVLRNNKNALIIDFFAGSGTTLNAVNLLNAEDNGNRRCILVTNNECSEAEAKNLSLQGFQPGDPEWECHGVCQEVTWPRTKNTITGRRNDGTTLDGDYFTSQTRDIEKDRTFYQVGLFDVDKVLTTAEKKQLVSLIGKDKLPKTLVKNNSQYIVSKKHSASILFNTEYAEQWLEALEEQDHIIDYYVVTTSKLLFTTIQQSIIELLGPIVTQEQLRRPMSDGFAANAEYFKLGFLDKNSVELGANFKSILPMLWLQSGAVGKCPELLNEDLPEIFIPENGSFAVLLEEYAFSDFKQELKTNPQITHAYIVTNSQITFREMSSQLTIPTVKQLYRDYIDNFTINARRNNI